MEKKYSEHQFQQYINVICTDGQMYARHVASRFL